MSLLIKHRADVHVADTFLGETAIHHAAQNGHHDVSSIVRGKTVISHTAQNRHRDASHKARH